eukprot:IDg23185t1
MRRCGGDAASHARAISLRATDYDRIRCETNPVQHGTSAPRPSAAFGARTLLYHRNEFRQSC